MYTIYLVSSSSSVSLTGGFEVSGYMGHASPHSHAQACVLYLYTICAILDTRYNTDTILCNTTIQHNIQYTRYTQYHAEYKICPMHIVYYTIYAQYKVQFVQYTINTTYTTQNGRSAHYESTICTQVSTLYYTLWSLGAMRTIPAHYTQHPLYVRVVVKKKLLF